MSEDSKAPTAAPPLPMAPAKKAPDEITFAQFLATERVAPALGALMAHLHNLRPASKASRDKFAELLGATRKARL